ncbi:zinc-dependent alcohol dehydrogenase [Rhizobium glycinendophyticum]|uniref:Zinc-binding alcohol dehydrogenase n=1 Tax=Rhizobium glycinendophyticum TaxID=2589807 RepID=A0A504TR67_9HYPH|nr:zinc-binding alcohol dehydrogenase [Rhizobium glycinendophyticum]TPP04629.1 zinc-binding alcohol dehydrogenase [Rhizobium glycinendophyticum]
MKSHSDEQSVSLSLEAKALWIEAAGQCDMRREVLKLPGPDEVLVRTLYSGISRGTESLIFEGRVPPSEYERMRGPGMEGDFPFPVKYGYAAVGVVEQGPPELLEREVFCLHPHQDFFVVPAGRVTMLPLSLPPRRAILAANMETALNVVWDAAIQPGDRVAVFGAGVVGTLIAYLSSRIAGTDTILIDREPRRASLAASLGLHFTTPEDIGEVADLDVVINATASPQALAAAIELAGLEARIVEASWYGDRSVALPLGGAFHARRLSLVSSQVGNLPVSHRARWTFARRIAKALDLLLDVRLDSLISGETPFAELPAAYARILSRPDTLCHRIRY